jgi:hypothetical protein
VVSIGIGFNVTESTPVVTEEHQFFYSGNSATFTDVVSFSNLSTAGQTVIDGSNMTTGTISSNFVTGIAPYSTSGTLIDLTNGSIISKTLVLIQVVLQHLEVLWLEVALILEVVTSQLIQMVM